MPKPSGDVNFDEALWPDIEPIFTRLLPCDKLNAARGSGRA
jgi:hypothetical protein